LWWKWAGERVHYFKHMQKARWSAYVSHSKETYASTVMNSRISISAICTKSVNDLGPMETHINV
jgi:hypothetical protein